MKIGIVVYGSDGETQPHVELAIALAKNNHEVEIFIISVRNRDYSSLNNIKGIKVIQRPFPVNEMSKKFVSNEFWKFNRIELYEYFDLQFKLVRSLLRRYSSKIVKTNDLVIGNRQAYPLRFCAEAAKVPYISLSFEPAFIRSKYYPPLGSPEGTIESHLDAWKKAEIAANEYLLPQINAYRKQYALPEIKNYYNDVMFSDTLNLVSFSKHLLGGNIDWEDNHCICGYFNSNEKNIHWDMPQSLQAFISAGQLPIFITLGSLIDYEDNIKTFHNMLITAVKQANCRAIIMCNKPVDNILCDESIYFIDGFVDYSKILPHCRLVIHHGGVGTLHAVASSGIPSIVIAYGFDQFTNAKLLVKAGICKSYLDRKTLDSEKIQNAIRKSLEDDNLIVKARELGALIKKEKGLDEAVKTIEKEFNMISI